MPPQAWGPHGPMPPRGPAPPGTPPVGAAPPGSIPGGPPGQGPEGAEPNKVSCLTQYSVTSRKYLVFLFFFTIVQVDPLSIEESEQALDVYDFDKNEHKKVTCENSLRTAKIPLIS